MALGLLPSTSTEAPPPAPSGLFNRTALVSDHGPVLLLGVGWSARIPSGLSAPCGWSTETANDSAQFTFRGTALYVKGSQPDVTQYPNILGTIDGFPLSFNPQGRAASGQGGRCNEFIYVKEGLEDGDHTFAVTLIGSVKTPFGPTVLTLQAVIYTTHQNSTITSSSVAVNSSTTSSTRISSSEADTSSTASTSSKPLDSQILTTPMTVIPQDFVTSIDDYPPNIPSGTSTTPSATGLGNSASLTQPIIKAHPTITTSPNVSSIHFDSKLTTIISTTEAAAPTSSGNITNPVVNPATPKHNTPVIAGSVVGGLVFGAILLATAYAFTQPAWVSYALVSTSTALGIGGIYHVRRLIIKKQKGLVLPDTKIALFVTIGKSATFQLDENLVVWQASIVNADNNFFEVDIPCTGRQTRLFFGTFSDDGTRIGVDAFEEAPAILEDEQGLSRWRQGTLEPPTKARNDKGLPTSIVLGTGSVSGRRREKRCTSMSPFLRIPEGSFKPGDTFDLKDRLYLRAFRVGLDCQVGHVGERLPLSSNILENELTKSTPIDLDNLAPLTTWNITGKKDGGLLLEIGRNNKQDQKRFKHECAVRQEANRGTESERVETLDVDP